MTHGTQANIGNVSAGTMGRTGPTVLTILDSRADLPTSSPRGTHPFRTTPSWRCAALSNRGPQRAAILSRPPAPMEGPARVSDQRNGGHSERPGQNRTRLDLAPLATAWVSQL